MEILVLLEVVLEFAIIGACVIVIFRFLEDRRGAGAARGVFVMAVGIIAATVLLEQSTGSFPRITYLVGELISIATILLIVVFQPELRQGAIKLGQTRFFQLFARAELKSNNAIDNIADAMANLSKSNFGAIVAIERQDDLTLYINGGQQIDAIISTALLENIFQPNAPLHDLGVVIRKNRILIANALFPLDESEMTTNLGSRHRAALGLSKRSDALIIAVSEENGNISLIENGKQTIISHQNLKVELHQKFILNSQEDKR